MRINISHVSVEILHMGKCLSGFIVLNNAKEGLFLHKISHLTRTTWCTIASHKPVMSQIPFQNKSHIAEADSVLIRKHRQFSFLTLGGCMLQPFKCTNTATIPDEPSTISLSFFWLLKWLFKYLTNVLSISRNSVYMLTPNVCNWWKGFNSTDGLPLAPVNFLV